MQGGRVALRSPRPVPPLVRRLTNIVQRIKAHPVPTASDVRYVPQRLHPVIAPVPCFGATSWINHRLTRGFCYAALRKAGSCRPDGAILRQLVSISGPCSINVGACSRRGPYRSSRWELTTICERSVTGQHRCSSRNGRKTLGGYRSDLRLDKSRPRVGWRTDAHAAA
jgi:hypothetical protein